jgi:hypothetical protein
MPINVLSRFVFDMPVFRCGIVALILLALLPACSFMARPSQTERDAGPFAGIDLPRQSASQPHKKTVTFTRFQVANSLQVEDIADIWNGYPLELLRRLEARGNILGRHSTATLFPDPRNLNPHSSASSELVRRIAEQDGSQWVISGIILDAAISDESLRPYFGWQGRETGRRFELGLPWNSVVAGVRPVATERRLEVEIFIYDGLSGTLLKRHRNNAEISGRVAVRRDMVFASAAFFDSDLGESIDRLIDIQTGLIDSDLTKQRNDASTRK